MIGNLKQSSDMSFHPNSLPAAARSAFEEAYYRVDDSAVACLLWERVFSNEERNRLGGDFGRAHSMGAIEMWTATHGVSPQRAVLDIARAVNLMTEHDHKWLRGEIGEDMDGEVALQSAIQESDLVITEMPRAVYWHGNLLEVDWYRHREMWDYISEMSRRSKVGEVVDCTVLVGENSQGRRDGVVAQKKSRLKSTNGVPLDLVDAIESAGRGSQKLNIARDKIRIFVREGLENLKEWSP